MQTARQQRAGPAPVAGGGEQGGLDVRTDRLAAGVGLISGPMPLHSEAGAKGECT